MSNAADYVIFHGNSTMEAGRGTAPKAVGFWIAKGDEITVHLLVAPRSPIHQMYFTVEDIRIRI